MLVTDSTNDSAKSAPRLIQLISNAFSIAIDMLAMVMLTLFYDGLVVALIFGIEFSHYSKSNSAVHLLGESAQIAWLGLGVGLCGVLVLVARKNYQRAIAALVSLTPLALFIYFA